MTTQSLYQQAIVFATNKHVAIQQTVPGTNMPYVVHLSNVAMEILIAGGQTKDFDLNFAVQVALLHDTLEDTQTSRDEIAALFGTDIADAVSALTKSDSLPKHEKMNDSLARIKKLNKEVASVKLADRITNLQKPPDHWDMAKRNNYQQEARLILDELGGANQFLADRLNSMIEDYKNYCS
jgi:guanosine-3',5'-bis(diphosphate) 3'-pyrophosphohydrolase